MLCTPPADIVVFLLDDMRADQLDVLEETLERLEGEAVSFERAYVTTPLCCPERASFLSGGWLPQDTGVLTNTAPMGGALAFYDAGTLPTRLQEAGYFTALVGKYLNEYEELGPYVPPGWSHFAATDLEGGWFYVEAQAGSSTPGAPGVARPAPHDGYLTDWQGAEALRVLEMAQGPLFLYLAFHAPHNPPVPAPQDEAAFGAFLYRDGAYNEEDLSDKPAWVQDLPKLRGKEEAAADHVNRQRQRTLLAADRAMAAVIDAVRASPRAGTTVFVVASDNGLMWGEHRLLRKGVAYEESVRVPLLIGGAGISPGQIDGLVALNLDLAATVQALAGLEPEGAGVSLAPALCGGSFAGRDAVVLQAWDTAAGDWSAVVTPTDKLIEGADGSLEYYDLSADPFEESSLHLDPSLAQRRAALREILDAERGLAIVAGLPKAVIDQPYRVELQHWGGEGALTWSAAAPLPPGLRLDPAGVLEGTPEAVGDYELLLQLEDQSRSPVHGGPQRVQATLPLRVGRCGCGEGRALLPFFVGPWLWRRRRIR